VPGAGFALKQHQKLWAQARGLDAITWTFDPLVRRNCVFNFEKLGAIGVEYLPNFYGTMVDAINAGDDSDRLFAYWNLKPSASATETTPTTSAECLLVELPADIEKLRKTDLAAAQQWRVQVREQLEEAMQNGYQVTGILNRTHLVLEQPIPSKEMNA